MANNLKVPLIPVILPSNPLPPAQSVGTYCQYRVNNVFPHVPDTFIIFPLYFSFISAHFRIFPFIFDFNSTRPKFLNCAELSIELYLCLFPPRVKQMELSTNDEGKLFIFVRNR